jgi:hypothetical protein
VAAGGGMQALFKGARQALALARSYSAGHHSSKIVTEEWGSKFSKMAGLKGCLLGMGEPLNDEMAADQSRILPLTYLTRPSPRRDHITRQATRCSTSPPSLTRRCWTSMG